MSALSDDTVAPPRRRTALVGGLWFAASQVLPIASTAVLSVVLGKVLGPDELGFQSLIAYTEATLSGVVVWALTTSSIQSLSALRGEGGEPATRGMTWWSFRAHLVLGLITTAILVAVGLVRADDRLSWTVAGLSALANAWSWAYGSRIIAVEGWGRVGRRRLNTQFAATAFGIVAILLGGGIVWIFVGNVIGAIWLALSLHRILPAGAGTPTLRPPTGFPRLWGMLLIGEVLANIVAKRSEYFFLDAYSSDSEIAMYSITFMIVMVAASIPAALGGASMPIIAAAQAGGETDVVRENMARSLRVFAVLSLALGAIIYASAPGLILAIYGSEFARAASLMGVAAIGMVVVPITGLCTDYWAGRGRLAAVVASGAAAAVVDIGLSFVLIPTRGAYGAVVANLLAQMIAFTVLAIITWRELGWFRWNAGRLAAMLVVSVGAAGLGGWVGTRVGGIGGPVLSALVVLVTLVVAGALGRVIAKDDLEWLAGFLPARLRRRPLSRRPTQHRAIEGWR